MKNLLPLLFISVATSISAQNIDLTTSSFVATVVNEKKLNFTYNVRNTGTNAAPGFSLKLTFSADAVLDFNDQFVVNIPYQASAVVGGGTPVAKTGTYNASSPAGYLPIGSWNVFVEVNDSKEVIETNYGNNSTLGNKITVNSYVINFGTPPVISGITDNSFVIETASPSETDMDGIYYLVQLNGVAAPSETTMRSADTIYPWIKETTVTNLGPGVDYDVYFMGHYYDEKVTSIYKIDVKTAGDASPTVVVSKPTISFEAVNKNSESAIAQYNVKGFYLTSDVTVSTLGKFLLSKNNSTFTDQLAFTASEFSGGAEKTIFVKFVPGGEAGSFTGDIVHSATNAQNQLIALTAVAFDPSNNNFDGLTDIAETGWTGVSVSGYHAWQLIDRDNTTMGRPSSDDKVLRMDGSINGNTTNEDWLVSPRIDLSIFLHTPTLTFESYTSKEGAPLQLKYSANYLGEGPLTDATWVDLDGLFPGQDSKVWTTSPGIELPKSNNLHVAFVYKSTGTAAARWLIDKFFVHDRLLSIPALAMNFQNVMVGTASTAKSFDVKIVGHGNITVMVTEGYQISLDNITFASSVTIPEAQVSAGQTIYIRFTPTGVVENLTGTVSFSGTDLAVSRSNLVGSTSITTAIENSLENHRSVYPNPTRGAVHVNSSDLTRNLKNATVRIFSVHGQEIGRFEAGVIDLDGSLSRVMESVNPGVYVIEVRSGDVMVREKIIKE